MGGDKKLSFEEGSKFLSCSALQVFPKDNLGLTSGVSTTVQLRSLSIPEFQKKAKITLVSATSIVEGGAHDVVLKETASTSK